jgi:hypothetical protein
LRFAEFAKCWSPAYGQQATAAKQTQIMPNSSNSNTILNDTVLLQYS